MDNVAWNAVLFALKWVLIGLVYVTLGAVVIAVRGELRMRVGGRRSAAAVAPGRLKIVNAGGDKRLRSGESIPLQPETTLGADPDNDLVVRDPFASARHARLRWDGVRWWVEDLGSLNGTFVNGVQARPGAPQPVPPGSNISLGGGASFEMTE